MKSFNKRLATSKITLIITFLLYANLSNAAGNNAIEEPVTWYQIEVILFKNLIDYEQDNDHLSVDLPAPSEQYVLVERKPMVKNQLQRLDKKTLKFNKAFKSLARSKGFKVLEFAGWKQQLVTSEKGTPVTIAAGQKFGKHHELEGQLTFSKSRYLHVQTDLYLSRYEKGNTVNIRNWLLEDDINAAPLSSFYSNGQNDTINAVQGNTALMVAPKNNANNTIPDNSLSEDELEYVAKDIAHMSETRRMRSGEIHYLDHPRFGVLITIEPTDPPFVYTPPPIPVVPESSEPKSTEPTTSNEVIGTKSISATSSSTTPSSTKSSSTKPAK